MRKLFQFALQDAVLLSLDGAGLMFGADTTALSGLAKDVFEQGVSEGVNNAFPLKEEFPVEQVDWKGGLGTKFTHHFGRNTSPFFAGEDSAYPVAGNQTHAQGRIDMKKLIARIRMTEEAMADLVSSEASFRNGMTDEKTRLVDDIARREEHALGMDGRGVLALQNGASAAVLPVDSPGNIAGANFGNRFLDIGMFVAAINPASGAIRANVRQITAASADGTTVTLTSDPTWVDNDFIVQAANASVTDIQDTAFEKAFWGLPALIDDGTNRDNYFGILRTQVPSLQSFVVAAVGALSLDVAQRTADVVYEKLGGIINVILMHQSVRREYIKLLDADRRYMGSDLQAPDGGTKAFTQGDLTIGEVAIKAIRTIGLAQVYFLDTKKSGFKRYVAEPGKFMDRDGLVWIRDGSGANARHAYEATYFCRKQYFAKNPGLNARWDGVTGQTLVVVKDL
jgi:hypothetical protein